MDNVLKIKGMMDALKGLEQQLEPVQNEYKALTSEISTLKTLIETSKLELSDEIRGDDTSVYFDKFQCGGMNVSCRKLPVSVIVDDVEALPENLIRVKREADKASIKKQLEAGNDVVGASLSGEEYRLVVDYVD